MIGDRVVRSDKKGLYVINDRRRWRPKGPTVHAKGDKVDVGLYATGLPNLAAKGTQVYVYGYKTVKKMVTPQWQGSKPYEQTTYERINVECWECHDPDPRPAEQIKQGWKKFDATVERGHMSVVVASDDGYDYGQFRRAPTGYKAHISKQPTVGINVHLHVSGYTSGHVQMTWAQWDELVKTIEEDRNTVQVAPIANKLEEEIRLDEELQTYMQEKGLVEATPEQAEMVEANGE